MHEIFVSIICIQIFPSRKNNKNHPYDSVGNLRFVERFQVKMWTYVTLNLTLRSCVSVYIVLIIKFSTWSTLHWSSQSITSSWSLAFLEVVSNIFVLAKIDLKAFWLARELIPAKWSYDLFKLDEEDQFPDVIIITSQPMKHRMNSTGFFFTCWIKKQIETNEKCNYSIKHEPEFRESGEGKKKREENVSNFEFSLLHSAIFEFIEKFTLKVLYPLFPSCLKQVINAFIAQKNITVQAISNNNTYLLRI